MSLFCCVDSVKMGTRTWEIKMNFLLVQPATWWNEGETNSSVDWMGTVSMLEQLTVSSVHVIITDSWRHQLEYAGVDVVQLRFLRLHSHKSFQHMTVSCLGNSTAAAVTDSTTQRVMHFLGDSGKEIPSQQIGILQKGCEVSLNVIKSHFFFFLVWQFWFLV